MDKHPAVLYKTLVVGVIVLFIGVGIQPALADLSNISLSDNENDCELCPKVSKQHINGLKARLNRFEKYNNQLSLLSSRNPKVEEELLGLSDKTTTFETLSSNSSVCDFLYNYFIFVFLKCVLVCILIDSILNIFYPLFYELYWTKTFFVFSILVNLSFLFDCPDWEWPPPYKEYNIGV